MASHLSWNSTGNTGQGGIPPDSSVHEPAQQGEKSPPLPPWSADFEYLTVCRPAQLPAGFLLPAGHCPPAAPAAAAAAAAGHSVEVQPGRRVPAGQSIKSSP